MRAILYARFSPRPDAAECDSIAKQFERCRAYCVANGYEVAGEFEDADLSGGRADNRPGLVSALDRACELKAVIVCYDLSRLARKTRDALDISERLQKSGAHLAFLDMKIDTTSPTGQFVFTLFAALAQMYRDQIRERTAKAMRAHQKSGRIMGSIPPYGWKRAHPESKRLEPVYDEQAILNFILDLAAKGLTAQTIGNYLTADGFTCRGKIWRGYTIQRIINRSNRSPDRSPAPPAPAPAPCP